MAKVGLTSHMEPDVAGSSPVSPYNHGGVAQQVERRNVAQSLIPRQTIRDITLCASGARERYFVLLRPKELSLLVPWHFYFVRKEENYGEIKCS